MKFYTNWTTAKYTHNIIEKKKQCRAQVKNEESDD